MRYRVNDPKVINETIDGEAIMINLESGNYYSLDRVGGEVWQLVEQRRSPEEMVGVLAGRYDAPEVDLRQAVDELLDRLQQEQLVVPADEDGWTAPLLAVAGAEARRRPFTAPRLEKFTDMQDLILLDPVHEVDSRGWPHAAGS